MLLSQLSAAAAACEKDSRTRLSVEETYGGNRWRLHFRAANKLLRRSRDMRIVSPVLQQIQCVTELPFQCRILC
jgi:hypothetical protein